MSVVTVSSGTIENYGGSDASPKLRVYAHKTFTPSTGPAIVRGRVNSPTFFKEIECTAEAGVVTFPTFDIDSTEDGVPDDSYYTFALVSSEGAPLGVVHQKIFVPASPSTTTLGALAVHSEAAPETLPNSYYTATQVDGIVASLTDASQKATEVITGSSRLSTPAANPAIPIAVGDNDTRVGGVIGAYAKNSLPAAGTAGRFVKLTDANKGVMFDTGSQWVSANSEIFDVRAFGATGDGSTDDTTAIQAAIAAAMASSRGGTVFFPRPSVYYKCTGQLNLNGAYQVTLRGEGSPSGLGNTTNGAIVYTGSGSTAFITARASQGLKIEHLRILYTSATFTGDLIDLSGTGTDTQCFRVHMCELRGNSTSAKNARSLINIFSAIIGTISECQFTYAYIGILGKTAGGYSNVMNIVGNTFLALQTAGIKNGGEQWMIRGNTFEPLIGGGAGAYTEDQQSYSLVFDGNWFGDASGGGHWVESYSHHFAFINNLVGDPGASDVAVLLGASGFAMEGVFVAGNTFQGSKAYGTKASAGAIYNFDSFADLMLFGGTYVTAGVGAYGFVIKNIIGGGNAEYLTDPSFHEAFDAKYVPDLAAITSKRLPTMGFFNAAVGGASFAFGICGDTLDGTPIEFWTGTGAPARRMSLGTTLTMMTHLLFTDNTYDIGASGATRPRTVYAAGGVLAAGPTTGIGYSTGAGGTVAQATSKATGVTLNKVCGRITMDAAALGGNTTVLFTFTNSTIAATDKVSAWRVSGGTAGAYNVWVDSVGAGSCVIAVRNITGGSLSEAVVLGFTVEKAVTA